MKIQTRSLNSMVEEQLVKWKSEITERKAVKAKPGPVITISREPGTGGSEIARRLAEQLKIGSGGCPNHPENSGKC
jgi:cytidylate kinase